MDEKTAELRDLFLEVTDEETVTETQEESPGSLADREADDDRLASLVATMRERCSFETDLSDGTLVAVVRRFYAGDDDDAIADAIGESPETVARARLDLHLLRERERDPPVDLGPFRDALRETDSIEAVADRFDLDVETARWLRRVARTREEIRRVNDQFRAEFESLLTDRDLSERLTGDTADDGLDDATEGQEIDLSF